VPTLFKLTLFRDGFGSGGERTMAQSQQSWFALPPKLVLAWQSRQRFDVQVEAINAWTRVWANRTGLNAATKPPSQPEAVRIFATQQVRIKRAEMYRLVKIFDFLTNLSG
jgi:hypothetical protein